MTYLPPLRVLVALTAALSLAGPPLQAREVTDATGRTVTVPDAPARVFAAGPPAAVLLYALEPDAMIGWVRGPRAPDLPYLLPSTHDLPELGRLTGRGDTLNLEVLLEAEPDLIIDFGTINDTYLSLATRVQEQTGVPYLLVDGSFENTPAAIRQLAGILGVPDRGEALAAYAEAAFAEVDATLAGIPEDRRPGVYLARGLEGLETAGPRSSNAEIITRVGARNVVPADSDGLSTVSVESILTWAPDAIVTVDRQFAAKVGDDPVWAEVPAVAGGRVYLAPSAPFGFIDSPPSVNRLIGLHWLMHKLYPDAVEGDLAAEVRDFYELFYHVALDDAAVAGLLGQ